jgi:hypothetical protein
MEEELSLFERPLVRAFLIFSVLLIAYFGLSYWIFISEENQQQGFNRMILDAVLCLGGLVLWTIFFSQFILPVRKLGDRLAILDRLMAYFSGFHGPAIFIENGNIRAREDERGKNGPGVLWLDHASAAMLRTATRFTRTIGPGIHFTKKDEYIAATVDLHTLTQNVGPNENENPFTVAKDDENFQNIQARGLETRGMTRDGIQIIAQISITFRIDAAPEEGGTAYGYNHENVRKVITESLVQGSTTDHPIWSPLPAKMAVDVWREYLSRFRLNQLFEIPASKDKTNLQLIGELLKNRMSNNTVEDLDSFGNFTGRTTPSPEARKLQEMGIKIFGVSIKRLILPPEIEERLVNRWTTTWEKNAKKEREQVEQDRRIREEKGQIDAQTQFADIMTSELQTTLPKNKRHAVYLFTHGIAQSVMRNPGLMERMSKNVTRGLAELAHWLKGGQ